jgi:hypothetical protein
VGFALRHSVAIGVVLAAVAATAGVLVFARPEYHPPYESKMIDFSKERYVSPATVRQAFAAHGIRLVVGDAPGKGTAWLCNERVPCMADALQVMVGPRTGRGSWGPKLEPYDERFGNVFVTYGGHDEALLKRVQSAVSQLR